MITIGIDPGLTGAIAIVCGASLRVYDVPVSAVKRGRTVRNRVDGGALQALLVRLSLLSPDYTCIEDVWGLPGQSAPAAHAFGVTCGMIAQGAIAAGLAPNFVAAATWKQTLRVPSDKAAALNMARETWPGCGYFDRQKDHGRAEAALIALYAKRFVMSDAPIILASAVTA